MNILFPYLNIVNVVTNIVSKFYVQGKNNPLVLLATVSYACYAFGVILIICELGQRMSDAIEGIWDTIDDFDWYSFPHDIQRFLPYLLIAAQRPVVLKCFGSTSGSRNTFKKVSLTNC